MITEKKRYNQRKLEIMLVLIQAKGTGKRMSCRQVANKLHCEPVVISRAMNHYMNLYPPWRNYFRRSKHKGSNAYYYTLTKYGLYILKRLHKLKKEEKPLQLYNKHFPDKHKGGQRND